MATMTAGLPDSPIFITGCPRSGTTLLLAVLDSHPELLVYPKESHFFNIVLPLFKEDPQAGLNFLFWDTSQLPWFPPELYENGKQLPQLHAQIREIFHQRGGTAQALLQALVLAHGNVTGQTDKSYWVEKTPSNEKHAKLIFETFPNAKMIYIVRDPRANLASYLKFKKITSKSRLNLLRFCLEWGASVELNNRHSKQFPVLTVKYEDLVCQPKETIQKICGFLNITFHEKLLQPTLNQVPFRGSSSYSLFETQFKGIDPSSLEKWKTELSLHEVNITNQLLAKPMVELGYNPGKWESEGKLSAFPVPYVISYHLAKFAMINLSKYFRPLISKLLVRKFPYKQKQYEKAVETFKERSQGGKSG